MLTGTLNRSISIAGVTGAGTVQRSAEGSLAVDMTLPAATAGSLTTRTSDTAGQITADGHGLNDGDKANIFWQGATPGCRYGVTIGAVDGDVVPFSLGAGDILPAAEAAVVIAEVVSKDSADLDGDTIAIMGVLCDKRAHIAFISSGDAVIGQKDLTALEDWSWAKDTGVANPLTGDPFTHLHASSGEAAAAHLQVGILYTP